MKFKHIGRRRFAGVAVLLAGALITAGCSSTATTGSPGNTSGTGSAIGTVTASSSGTAGTGEPASRTASSTSPSGSGPASSTAGTASGVDTVTGATSPAGTSSAPGTPTPVGGAVTLVTHDSFAVDKKVLADFEKSSGITITLLAQGDAGALVNKLVLTKDNPLGDAVFGIDNTFASRALEAGILAPYTSPELAQGSVKYGPGGDNRLSAVDYGDVCVNVDHAWFSAHRLAEPKNYEDLAKPSYKQLLVVESPATSSPGLAFLLGTIQHFGQDKWRDYWTALKANGVKVTAGWTDAYTVDFSGSSGKGARPLVVSYASSPPDEVKNGVAPTGALLDTCFRQIEYAGVLTGAKNPAAAQKVVDFLLSKPFQAGVAEQMYVYPVDSSTPLPPDWQKFAPLAAHPAVMDPVTISQHREAWISQWTDLVEG